MLRVAPLPLVATYAYVNPVVAVILGAIDPRRADRPAHDRRRRDHRDRGGAHRHRAEPDAGGPAAVDGTTPLRPTPHGRGGRTAAPTR